MQLRQRVDRYFRTEKNAYSKRRRIRTKSLLGAGGILFVLFSFGAIYFGGEAEKKSDDEKKTVKANNGALPLPQSGASQSDDTNAEKYLRQAQGSSAKPARNFGASQLVKRGDGNGSSENKVPMGTTAPAKLLNTIVSADSNSPVIAELLDDVLFRNALVIPRGTKAMGHAALDETTQRLQVRFHTLVFPEGDQYGVSALALQSDGSSGIPGSFHSGRIAKQGGRFIGKFAGGLAQGLKDRTASGFGRAYEPGNLKNGLLNGVAESAFDQAEIQAEEMRNARSYLEVQAGTGFLLYLEREFKP